MEVWKDIKNFEGEYMISTWGRVKSVERRIKVYNKGSYYRKMVRERILKPCVSTNGYLKVNLCNFSHLIHHLVAGAFIGKRPKTKDVCHNNGNKLDNNFLNLRYGTKKENSDDTFLNHKTLTRCKTTGQLRSTK